MAASLVLLTAARCGGDATSGSPDVADASAGGGTTQWRLTYSVDETGQEEVEATPASGGDGVTSTRRYRYSCRGEAILAAGDEEGTEFEGTPAVQCSYSSSGEFDMNVWREKMSGVGVPDTSGQTASLSLDPERHRYGVSLPIPGFTVVQTHDGSTCQSSGVDNSCRWTPYTKVDSAGESGSRVSLSDLTMPADGATLNGSDATPPETVPNATRRVTWTLAPVGVRPRKDDELAVEIDGPACACLDGEKVPGARVSWSARASRSGGSFDEFAVEAKGTASKVVENSGGTAARVILEPSRESGAVTLRATFTRDGRTVTATRDVSFCVIDSIRIADGERDFAFDDATPGVLTVPKARSRALYDGADASPELAWTIEPIGAAATTTLSPEHPTGGIVSVSYTGLPELNAALGPKRVEVALQKGDCLCKRASTIRAFYSPTAKNHPTPAAGIAPGTAPVPNWFYYYAQTPAIMGTAGVVYTPTRFSARDRRQVIAQFDEQDGNVYLADLLWTSVCRPAVPRGGKPVVSTGAGNDGIDCVAETVRHEAQHRVDWAAWWPHGYLLPSDVDTDGVPSDVEAQHPGCSRVNKMSCDERPFVDVGDREINAYWVGWQWQSGSIDAHDWACGAKGKQWKDGFGCADE